MKRIVEVTQAARGGDARLHGRIGGVEMKQTKKLDELLRVHIQAWQRSTKEPDFVEQVNDTYAAFLATGGSDDYCKKHWDRVKRSIPTQSREAHP